MPIYEYECEVCNYKYEFFQSSYEDNLRTCPKCGGNLKRVLSTVGVLNKQKECSFNESGVTCCGASEPCGRCHG